ncbi:endonuclease III [Clostridium sp. CAG:524]|mgnify:FL=1|nr:endonuclease III [Clostridium sp.]CDA60533.1 endonuclease III [Clostridium sp. CAG:524]
MNKDLIINEFDKHFNDPKCELEYTKDYELLLSVMLSAQTTDKSVNMVTRELYKKYDTLDKLDTLTLDEIDNYIRSIGLHKTKSKYFKEIVTKIKEIGYVPNDREFLESLSGVGRKTASVVLGILFDIPSFAVDTHVYRVSKRLGITTMKDDVLKTEIKLKKYFDEDEWNKINSQMVLFGRYICTSKNPKCDKCHLKNICKYK